MREGEGCVVREVEGCVMREVEGGGTREVEGSVMREVEGCVMRKECNVIREGSRSGEEREQEGRIKKKDP